MTKRRCVWASSEAITSARALACMSIQGEMSAWPIELDGIEHRHSHSVCIQVVPHLGGVLITMSSARNANAAHL